MKTTFPKEWEPTKLDINSGWKNKSKVLSEIVTAINDEIYVEDENDLMEKMDVALEYLKSKYKITPL